MPSPLKPSSYEERQAARTLRIRNTGTAVVQQLDEIANSGRLRVGFLRVVTAFQHQIREGGLVWFTVYHSPLKNLELAVLALARIMCANIHSQNGTAILSQALLFTQVRKFESFSFYPLDLCYRHVWCTSEL